MMEKQWSRDNLRNLTGLNSWLLQAGREAKKLRSLLQFHATGTSGAMPKHYRHERQQLIAVTPYRGRSLSMFHDVTGTILFETEFYHLQIRGPGKSKEKRED